MDSEAAENKIQNDKRKNTIAIICIVLGCFIIFAIPIVIFVVSLATYKYNGYSGKHPELFTVAIDSIPDAKGFLSGEIMHEPVLSLVEEDNYGRKMFCYMDSDYNDGKIDAPIYMLICQTKIDGEAYYYSDYVWTVSYVTDYPKRVHLAGTGYTSRIDNPLSDFSDEQIEKLKQDNDWGKELNLDKCVKAEIVRKKK